MASFPPFCLVFFEISIITMKLAVPLFLILTVLTSLIKADFSTTQPDNGTIWYIGQTYTISWTDNGQTPLISSRSHFSVVLGDGGKGVDFNIVTTIATFNSTPFPNSTTYTVPSTITPNRYFLVYTDDTPDQPKSDYFYIEVQSTGNTSVLSLLTSPSTSSSSASSTAVTSGSAQTPSNSNGPLVLSSTGSTSVLNATANSTTVASTSVPSSGSGEVTKISWMLIFAISAVALWII